MSIKNSIDLKISSLEFVVTPIQISLEGQGGQSYFVEFNKGAQIIKKFDEEIIASSSKSLYLFKKGELAKFKLSYQRGCKCEWGVYKIISRDSYQFIDSLPINLLEYYQNFINSLRPLQKDYQKILSEKGQGKEVSKVWSALKSAALWEYSSIFAKNRSGNIEICFRLQIRCELDAYCQLQSPNQRPKSQKVIGLNVVQTSSKGKQAEQSKMQENITIEVSSPKYQEQYQKIQLPPPRMGIDFSCKRDSMLSQILQRSNENQSNFNYGDKKQQLQQISGIPEEESEVFSPPITNTKTINFQGIALKGGDDFIKRRCNTYDSNFNDGNNNLSDKWIRNLQHQVNEDQELGKQELRAIMETSPQSRVATQKSKEETKINSYRIKWIIAIVLLLFICGGALVYKRSVANKKEAKGKLKPAKQVKNPKGNKDLQIKKKGKVKK